MEGWHIVAGIPLLLHVSLFLFLGGLWLRLRDIDRHLGLTVGVPSLIIVSSYVVVTLLPIFTNAPLHRPRNSFNPLFAASCASSGIAVSFAPLMHSYGSRTTSLRGVHLEPKFLSRGRLTSVAYGDSPPSPWASTGRPCCASTPHGKPWPCSPPRPGWCLTKTPSMS